MLTGIDKLAAAHDAKLVALRYQSPDSIRLEIETPHSGILTIYLSGVYLFAGQNFLEGNIILDVSVQAFDALTDQDIEYVTNLEAQGREKDRLAKEIETRKLYLFLLEPSYGAEVAAFCSEIAVV